MEYGIMYLQENARAWRVAANAVAFSPVLIGILAWFYSLHGLGRFGLGLFLGFTVSALYFLTQLHRSQVRRSKAARVAQLCRMDAESLKLFADKLATFQNRGYEKVDWVNMELEEIWPSLNEAASGLLKVILQSVLDPYKFSIIQKIVIKSVTLGTVSPLIGGIKFRSGGEDEVVLEAELDWRHGQDSKIIIQLQTTGPVLTIQIKDFVIYGVLRLIFKPLKEQFPGFGALTLSLCEPPTVDFQTKFLGGDILMIPGVDNVVDNIIRTALTDTLVWPNRIVIPILEGDYSYLNLKPVGKLEVELVEAQNVFKADIWGESDPYAYIYIRRKQGCIYTSSVKTNTKCPVWNEKHVFDVEDPESQKLTIQLFDYDRLKMDDFIGIGEFALQSIRLNVEQDIWLDLTEDLTKAERKFRGKVHLRVIYKPFALNNDIGE